MVIFLVSPTCVLHSIKKQGCTKQVFVCFFANKSLPNSLPYKMPYNLHFPAHNNWCLPWNQQCQQRYRKHWHWQEFYQRKRKNTCITWCIWIMNFCCICLYKRKKMLMLVKMTFLTYKVTCSYNITSILHTKMHLPLFMNYWTSYQTLILDSLE